LFQHHSIWAGERCKGYWMIFTKLKIDSFVRNLP
jgi:hypothetical protein